MWESCGTGSKSKKKPAAAEGKAKASPKATKRAGTEKDKTETEPVAKAVETMNTGPEIDVTVEGKRFKVMLVGNCQDVEKKTDKEAKENNGEKKEKLAEASNGEMLAEESTSEKDKENDEDELPVSQTSTLVLGESPKKKKHTPKESFCFARICYELFVSHYFVVRLRNFATRRREWWSPRKK